MVVIFNWTKQVSKPPLPFLRKLVTSYVSDLLLRGSSPRIYLIDVHAIAFNGCDTQVIDVDKLFHRTRLCKIRVIFYKKIVQKSILLKSSPMWHFLSNSHIREFHCGTKHIKLNFSNNEFFIKLDFTKIKFQNRGILLHSFETGIFCYIVCKLGANAHFLPKFCMASTLQNIYIYIYIYASLAIQDFFFFLGKFHSHPLKFELMPTRSKTF